MAAGGTMRNKGFTIVEALITTLVVAVILSLVAGFLTEYTRIVRFSSNKDKALYGLQATLDSVKGDVAGAMAVITPQITETPLTVPGPYSSQLVFTKIDASTSTRLPTAMPSPRPSVWNPNDPAFISTIRYYVAGGTLLREVTFSDRSVRRLVVVNDIAGFSVQDLGSSTIAIKASFLDESMLKTLTTRVHLTYGQWQ